MAFIRLSCRSADSRGGHQDNHFGNGENCGSRKKSVYKTLNDNTSLLTDHNKWNELDLKEKIK